MPNGTDDRVRIEFNGQTGTVPRTKLQKYIDKGAKVVPTEKPSSFDKFSMDVAEGMGFDPQKLIQAYETGGGGSQLKELGSEALSGLTGLAKRPLDFFTSTASGFTRAAGLPDKPGESFHTPVPGQLVGATANVLGASEGFESLPSRPKPVIRDLLGVGERDVARQIEKTSGKQAKAVEASTKKVEAAKTKYADAVQEHIQAKTAASAKETAAKTKQEALGSKHGPVYQRINKMTDDVQSHISDVQKKVGAEESAKWDAFNKKLDNPKVETDNVRTAIESAGEKLPPFKQIMQEIGDEDIEVKQMLEKMNPAVRERAIAAGVTPDTGITLNTARRLYTKLNQYLNGKELPPGVAREGFKVLEQLDDSIAKSVAQNGGPEALSQYRTLQKNWAQYRQTFFDRSSPLRKITEAKDPNTKLNPIVGETGARAIDYLGRYKEAGADPAKIGRIRAMHKALKELPTSGAKAPEAPARPELGKVAEPTRQTPESARREMLTSKESFYSRPPSRWELMFPPLLMYKMGLKHLMQNPKFIDWLSREGGGGGSSTPVP